MLLGASGPVDQRVVRSGVVDRDIEQTLTDGDGKTILSHLVISRSPKNYTEYERWNGQDLSSCDVVYLFLDGVYVSRIINSSITLTLHDNNMTSVDFDQTLFND